MASTVTGGLFNAMAFAGASFMFSKFNHAEYTKEIHRQDFAIEKMTEARNRWEENRKRELDRLGKLREEKIEAGKDMMETSKAFLTVKTKFDAAKPVLGDFYRPSKEMDEYLTFVKFLATAPVLYGVHALFL